MRPLKWGRSYTFFIMVSLMLIYFSRYSPEIAYGYRVDSFFGWPLVWFITHDTGSSFWVEYNFFNLLGNLVFYGVISYCFLVLASKVYELRQINSIFSEAFVTTGNSICLLHENFLLY